MQILETNPASSELSGQKTSHVPSSAIPLAAQNPLRPRAASYVTQSPCTYVVSVFVPFLMCSVRFSFFVLSPSRGSEAKHPCVYIHLCRLQGALS